MGEKKNPKPIVTRLLLLEDINMEELILDPLGVSNKSGQ